MSTLKLPSSRPRSVNPARKPVRRNGAPRRVRPAIDTQGVPDAKPQAPVKTSKARQRNHRYDGSLREPESAVEADSTRSAAGRDVSRANKNRRAAPAGPRNEPRRGGKLRDGFEPGRKADHRAVVERQAADPQHPRLSKRMAELGLCSRREADEWISNGWVKVDGQVVDVLGTRVAPQARIEVSQEAERHQSERVTILLHKPVGYVSGQAEDGYAPAAVLIHPDNQWTEDPVKKTFQRGFLRGLAPAGRLDIDSTGLLVLTQDGRVARRLIGADSTVEKEYLVRVTGTLSDAGLKLLNFGLELDGVPLKPAKVSWQNEDQLRFLLREGKKRQIRRMCELVGLQVVGLKRVRIGSLPLGKLPVGQWRYLKPGERF